MNAGFPVALWLLSDTARVLILVQDDSPRPPARTVPEADAEAGRGPGRLGSTVDTVTSALKTSPRQLAASSGHFGTRNLTGGFT
jgi:hypothetical protein